MALRPSVQSPQGVDLNRCALASRQRPESGQMPCLLQLPAPPDVLGRKGQYPRQAKGSGPGWSRVQAAPYSPRKGRKGQPFLRAAVWLLRMPRGL